MPVEVDAGPRVEDAALGILLIRVNIDPARRSAAFADAKVGNARMRDPVLLRGSHRSLRDERFEERPRNDTSSLSSTLRTAFSNDSSRDDSSGCHSLKIRLWTK